MYAVVAFFSFSRPYLVTHVKNDLWLTICNTNLSGGLSGLCDKTNPNVEAVILYLRVPNQLEDLYCSRVSLPILQDFSTLTASVCLKANMVTFKPCLFSRLEIVVSLTLHHSDMWKLTTRKCIAARLLISLKAVEVELRQYL